MIELRSFPRIHIALLDLGRATRRVYGGIGFALAAPFITLRAAQHDSIAVIGRDYLDDRGLHDLQAAIERLLAQIDKQGIRIEVITAPPQHVGLGSKTTIILGSLQATVKLWGANIPPHVLQNLSARGGTSGIGIHSFYHGGVIVDGGHASARIDRLGPSSSRHPGEIPPLITRITFPSSWGVHLLLPQNMRKLSGPAEIEFFDNVTPIAVHDTLAVMAAVYHGACVAFIERDLESLADSIKELNCVGFKPREVALHEGNRAVLESLWRIPGTATGMSSLGPLIYAITEKENKDVVHHIEKIALQHGYTYLGCFDGCNEGFQYLKSHE